MNKNKEVSSGRGLVAYPHSLSHSTAPPRLLAFLVWSPPPLVLPVLPPSLTPTKDVYDDIETPAEEGRGY